MHELRDLEAIGGDVGFARRSDDQVLLLGPVQVQPPSGDPIDATAREGGVSKVCLDEGRVDEVRTAQICAAQAGLAQVRLVQVRAGQVRPAQVGLDQARAGQACFEQVCLAQVG